MQTVERGTYVPKDALLKALWHVKLLSAADNYDLHALDEITSACKYR
jgi:hypothetical protein